MTPRPGSYEWFEGIALERVAITFRTDDPASLTFYGASPEAQERLEAWRMAGWKHIYETAEKAPPELADGGWLEISE